MKFKVEDGETRVGEDNTSKISNRWCLLLGTENDTAYPGQ